MSTAHARLPISLIGVTLILGCDPQSDHGITAASVAAPTNFAVHSAAQWSTPVNLGPVVNSSFSDQQAALSKDGFTLYFASNRPEFVGDAVLDNNIWASQRACTDDTDVACAWRTPVELPAPVNTASNDGAPSLSRDEHWLFLSSNR